MTITRDPSSASVAEHTAYALGRLRGRKVAWLQGFIVGSGGVLLVLFTLRHLALWP